MLYTISQCYLKFSLLEDYDVKPTVLIIFIFLGCENSYKPNNLIQITTHRIKPSMKMVYEDLVENEFAVANSEYRLEDPSKQKLHSIAMKSIEAYKPNKQNLNPVNLKDSIYTYVYISDPYIEGDYYKIYPKLVQKYGSEKANQLITKISKCFIPRYSQEILYFNKDD